MRPRNRALYTSSSNSMTVLYRPTLGLFRHCSMVSYNLLCSSGVFLDGAVVFLLSDRISLCQLSLVSCKSLIRLDCGHGHDIAVTFDNILVSRYASLGVKAGLVSRHLTFAINELYKQIVTRTLSCRHTCGLSCSRMFPSVHALGRK